MVGLVLGILGGLLVAAFFAACEGAFSALTSPSPVPAPERQRLSSRTDRLLQRPDRLQHGIALGHLLAVVWLAALAGRGLIRALDGDPGPAAWVAVVLGVGFLVLVLGELTPKALGIEHPRVLADRVAPLLTGWMTLLTPVHLVIDGLAALAERAIGPAPEIEPLTAEDVRSIVAHTSERAALEQDERRMLVSIFGFGDTTVREVMTPRPDLIAIEIDTPIDEVIRLIRDAEHSRVPVYDGSLDAIEGLLYAKDLLVVAHGLAQPPAALRALLNPVEFVPEAKRIDDLLREFQQRQTHLAVVVDEYGGTAGIVTLEDILEELVGEIQDEYDAEEPLVATLPDGTLRLDGRLDFDDFNQLTSSRIDGGEVETIGGLVAQELGRLPEEGEEVTVGAWTFQVEEVDGNRIIRIRAWRAPREEDLGADAGGGA